MNIYKVCLYRKDKLLTVFTNQGYNSFEEVVDKLSMWYDVKRNDQSAQFLVIDTEKDVITKVLDEPLVRSLHKIHTDFKNGSNK